MCEYARSVTRRELMRILSAVGFTSLSGCATVNGSSPANLRIGTLQPPVTLDPIRAKYVGSAQTIGTVFDGLYTYDTGTDIQPRIAAGPPTNEGRGTILVEIDDAATFHNGDPVTAEDVTYSFEAPMDEDTAAKADVSAIETIETVDEQSVRFRLDHAYPALDRALTRPIVPKSVREADKERFAKDPVGAGPYEVESFSEEKKVELTRWPEYWSSPRAEIAHVTIVYIESPITQMMSLFTDRTDMIQPVSPQLDDRIREVTNASVTARESYRSYYFGFNLNEGPTTDPAVREAISFCIDLDRAVEEFVEPFGRRQYSPLPPAVVENWGFPREEWRGLSDRKDIDRARRLFDRADTSGGQFTILTSRDPTWKEFGERLARGLRDAGRGALVKSVTWKTYLERYVSGSERDYSVFLGEVAGTPDPDSFLYPIFHENMQGLTNGVFYNEEAVMNALIEARRTTDRSRRRERYAFAIRRLLEDRVFLPVCSFDNSFAYDRTVRGFRVHPIAQLNPRIVSPDGAMTIGGRS